MSWSRHPWVRSWEDIGAERDAERAESFRSLGLHGLAESVDWQRDPASFDVEGELTEVFRSVGLSESQARVAGRGRAGRPVDADPFDELTGVFRSLGLSESAARTAATGRGVSELEARRSLAEVETESVPARQPGSQVQESGQPRPVELRESAVPKAPAVPMIVVETERLMAQGFGELEARRRAYRLIHGSDPGRAAG